MNIEEMENWNIWGERPENVLVEDWSSAVENELTEEISWRWNGWRDERLAKNAAKPLKADRRRAWRGGVVEGMMTVEVVVKKRKDDQEFSGGGREGRFQEGKRWMMRDFVSVRVFSGYGI
jgi:hypothetical protein